MEPTMPAKPVLKSKTILWNGLFAVLSALLAAIAIVQQNIDVLGLSERGTMLLTAGFVFVVTAVNIILRFMTSEPIK